MTSSSSNKNKIKLLESDSENEDKPQFSVNKNYAERYDNWRGKEELQKLKDRYGDDPDPTYESSESETTSEDEWTPEDEKSFLKALSSLKGKDPKIYDTKRQFFNKDKEEQQHAKSSISGKNKEKDKPFLIKDHEREMILQNRVESESEEEEETKKQHAPSYYEEQNEIKKSLKAALQGLDSDDEDNSKLLSKRVKTEKEVKEEEEDYRKWLKGELGKLDEKGKEEELKFLRDYWNDPKLDAGEQFLRDYILQRKYIEEESTSNKEKNNRIPTYDEIVHDSDEGGLSADEEHLEKMEQFENKFNFRFEEPDPEFIKKYPRTIEESYRRTESKRKQEREKAKERKQKEKEKKIAEIQQLKALKRKEICEKIEKLQKVAGTPSLPLNEFDLENDFDPDEHDARMEAIYNSTFYCESEDDKPIFPYDEEIDGDLEDIKPWLPEEEDEQEETHLEDLEESNIHEDEEPTPSTSTSKIKDTKSELLNLTKGKRMGKKKSYFLEALEKEKPKYDPTVHKSFEKYFDEYYKLDFEDLVGDIPCRFKYRQVEKNDFGLTTDEILEADDKELNQWASLKKTYLYRRDEEEKYDVQQYKKKAMMTNAKKKALPSLYSQKKPEDEDEIINQNEDQNGTTDSKKKKKKKKKKKTILENTKSEDVKEKEKKEVDSESIVFPNISKNQKRKSSSTSSKLQSDKKKKNAKELIPVTEDRLRAYGINPTKYAKRKKYAK